MHRPFLFRGFKSSPDILDNRLGALEREVMAKHRSPRCLPRPRPDARAGVVHLAQPRDDGCRRVAASFLTKRAGRPAPGLWLALRLSPAVLSLVFVAGAFLPSYWKYEPLEVEGFDVTLTLLAIVALGILGAAVVRGVAAWRRAAQRANDWMRVAASCGRGC